jgi:predicted RNA-binding Zn ribbon-like protein
MTTTTSAARPIGRWLDTADGLHWWFDPGALCLDFAYTGPLAGAETLTNTSALAEWLSPRFAEADGVVSDGDLRDALALREAIARLAVALARSEAPDPGDIDVINLYAAIPDIPPVLPGGSRRAGRATARTGQALSTVARDAVSQFADDPSGAGGRARVRACAAEDCDIVFVDESRSGNRRWCSMARCGNRAKVRAHRARRADTR